MTGLPAERNMDVNGGHLSYPAMLIRQIRRHAGYDASCFTQDDTEHGTLVGFRTPHEDLPSVVFFYNPS